MLLRVPAFDESMQAAIETPRIGRPRSHSASLSGVADITPAWVEAMKNAWAARGYPKGLSEYFATPYEGGGHHFLPKRTELPAWLGGGPVPPVINNSPLFLLKPGNMSTGDFLERHFDVDPFYGGGKIPAKFGGGRWSGRDLGWEKYDQLGRLWYGSPAPLKAVAGAGVVGAGAAVDQAWNGEGPP